MRRIVLYALGGGHGHAIRGAVVATALAERGAAVHLVVPAPRVALARALAADGVRVQGIGRPASRDELRSTVLRVVRDVDATELVVDTFPEGVLDELDDTFDRPRYALLRLRRDAGSERFQAGLARCNGAIDLEPHLQWLPAALADSVVPGAPTVRSLQRRDQADVALWCGGKALAPFLSRLGRRLQRHGLSVIAKTLRPAELDMTIEAPIVVGAAGFNLTYELRRAGVQHFAVPLRRPFDDQRRRAHAVAHVADDPLAFESAIVAESARLRVAEADVDDVPGSSEDEHVATWLFAHGDGSGDQRQNPTRR